MLPLTLSNPRWESFAISLAAGATAEDAYADAGFSDKNRKARAQALSDHPEIKERIAYLRSCLPRLFELKARYAPSHLLMPQTADDMAAWLWQVTSGNRKIPPLQLRAASLLIRVKGWHRPDYTPSHLKVASEAITSQERQLLAAFNLRTIEADTAGQAVPEAESRRLYSALADAELTGLEPEVPASSKPPQTSPNEAPQSPCIPLENQALTPSKSPNGDENTSSPSALNSPFPQPPQTSPQPPPPYHDLDALLHCRQIEIFNPQLKGTKGVSYAGLRSLNGFVHATKELDAVCPRRFPALHPH